MSANTQNSNDPSHWKTLRSKALVDAPWLKVHSEDCQLPSGKVLTDFYTLWQPDWVLILAQDLDGLWILTRQYRHGTGRMEIEFPAGIVDRNEDHVAAARRELQEECAHAGGEWKAIRSLPVNPDRHKGRFHIVRGMGVARQGQTAFDDAEQIETFKADTARVRAMIAEGLIAHPHHIAAFLLLEALG